MTTAQSVEKLLEWGKEPQNIQRYPGLETLHLLPQATYLLHGTKQAAEEILHIDAVRGSYLGLYICLHRDQNIISEDVALFAKKCRAKFHYWKICYGYQSAVNAITAYLGKNDAPPLAFRDCFAYNPDDFYADGGCRCLVEMLCRTKGKCKFYKSRI